MYRATERLHANIYALLRALGAKADNTYFFYTAYAILLMAQCPLRGDLFIEKVLKPVAKIYDKPILHIEYAICHTMDDVLEAESPLLSEVFPTQMPSSSYVFVSGIAAYLTGKSI